MNRDMEEGGCVNTPGQAGRNELRPYKVLVGAEGDDAVESATTAEAENSGGEALKLGEPHVRAARRIKPEMHVSGRAQTEVCATKNKNGRLAEAHRPFHIFVKWN